MPNVTSPGECKLCDLQLKSESSDRCRFACVAPSSAFVLTAEKCREIHNWCPYTQNQQTRSTMFASSIRRSCSRPIMRITRSRQSHAKSIHVPISSFTSQQCQFHSFTTIITSQFSSSSSFLKTQLNSRNNQQTVSDHMVTPPNDSNASVSLFHQMLCLGTASEDGEWRCYYMLFVL